MSLRRINNIQYILLTGAEWDARLIRLRERECGINTDNGEARFGPGIWKEITPNAKVDVEVNAVVTTNVTIATALNAGDTAGGLELTAGDTVLLVGQSAPAENGIYTAGVTPARTTGFTTYDAHVGKLIKVKSGTGANTLYRSTSAAGGTIDSTALAFALAKTGLLNVTSTGQFAALPAATLSGTHVVTVENPVNGQLEKTTLAALKTYVTS